MSLFTRALQGSIHTCCYQGPIHACCYQGSIHTCCYQGSISHLHERDAAEEGVDEQEDVDPDHLPADGQHVDEHDVAQQVDHDHRDAVPASGFRVRA